MNGKRRVLRHQAWTDLRRLRASNEGAVLLLLLRLPGRLFVLRAWETDRGSQKMKREKKAAVRTFFSFFFFRQEKRHGQSGFRTLCVSARTWLSIISWPLHLVLIWLRCFLLLCLNACIVCEQDVNVQKIRKSAAPAGAAHRYHECIRHRLLVRVRTANVNMFGGHIIISKLRGVFTPTSFGLVESH